MVGPSPACRRQNPPLGPATSITAMLQACRTEVRQKAMTSVSGTGLLGAVKDRSTKRCRPGAASGSDSANSLRPSVPFDPRRLIMCDFAASPLSTSSLPSLSGDRGEAVLPGCGAARSRRDLGLVFTGSRTPPGRRAERPPVRGLVDLDEAGHRHDRRRVGGLGMDDHGLRPSSPRAAWRRSSQALDDSPVAELVLDTGQRRDPVACTLVPSATVRQPDGFSA